MFLMVDNYDSFTYNLVQYFLQCGEEMEIIRNDDPLDEVDFSRYTGVVLSPGPSSPDNSGITLDILRLHPELPQLGVCLGMQAMAYQFGGDVVRAGKIMHGKTDTITHFGGDLFEGLPERFQAVRYHSLVAQEATLPDCFEIKARSSDGEIMALRHRERYLWGVQFHPESHLSENGMTIIKNFIRGAHEHSRKH